MGEKCFFSVDLKMPFAVLSFQGQCGRTGAWLLHCLALRAAAYRLPNVEVSCTILYLLAGGGVLFFLGLFIMNTFKYRSPKNSVIDAMEPITHLP